MRKTILPLFLALVFSALLSACKDSGGVPTVNQPLECVEGMDCYVAPPSQFVFEELPAPECVVDADCDSDELCNSGKCEETGSGGDDGAVGGGSGGTGSDEDDGDSNVDSVGDNGNSGGTGGSGGGGKVKIITFQGMQSLLLGTKTKKIIFPANPPITFPDANLKKAVSDAIKKVDPAFNKSNITVNDCAKITSIKYYSLAWVEVEGDNGGYGYTCDQNIQTPTTIKSLEGLQYCTGIKSLDLRCNQISDIGALEGLTKLTWLKLGSNQISDIGALTGLTGLTSLDLGSNQISDIGALKGLTGLTSLSLWYNQISDIGALKGLTGLTSLFLGSNQISDIGALKGLTGLTSLSLWYNQISDIDALKGLKGLTWLDLGSNQISDIGALTGLTKLKILSLFYNKYIYDIYPLVINADAGGFSADDSVIYLNGISTTPILADIKELEDKGIIVEYDGKK